MSREVTEVLLDKIATLEDQNRLMKAALREQLDYGSGASTPYGFYDLRQIARTTLNRVTANTPESTDE
jgi:hypothetical protein